MTVAELREALQRLEAEGKGALLVTYSNWWKDRHSDDEVADVEVRIAGPHDDYPVGTAFVRLV